MLTIRVRPGASKTMLRGTMADGTWKIDLAAPAEHGKANTELVRFLATEFEVPRSCIEILAGHAVRTKIVRITALTSGTPRTARIRGRPAASGGRRSPPSRRG